MANKTVKFQCSGCGWTSYYKFNSGRHWHTCPDGYRFEMIPVKMSQMNDKIIKGLFKAVKA